MEMVENAKSHFRAPVVASGQRSSTFDIPPPPISTPVTTLSALALPPALIE